MVNPLLLAWGTLDLLLTHLLKHQLLGCKLGLQTYHAAESHMSAIILIKRETYDKKLL